MITKTPTCIEVGRALEVHPNARAAFTQCLADRKYKSGEIILLPAYIGWSAREGSGVFDPITQLGLKADFYRLDGSLRIDLDHLAQRIEQAGAKALLLIHYFGHVDGGYATAVALARAANLQIIEDEAHAMLSDLIGGACGRLGDACIYSLHKLLPVSSGGVLVRNHVSKGGAPNDGALISGKLPHALWQHDLAAIAVKRVRNAMALAEAVRDLDEELTPLFAFTPGGEVPHTYPVRLRRANRDATYREMNEAGFGVVSLYHTMIEPIQVGGFPDAMALSRQILNLPVHQDATPGDMAAMVSRLKIALVRHRL